jgi:hypothetical protein
VRVFPLLCQRAREAGARRLVFTAELEEACLSAESGEGTDKAWSCEAGDREGDRIAISWGRTGEEALRAVVETMEAARRGGKR